MVRIRKIMFTAFAKDVDLKQLMVSVSVIRPSSASAAVTWRDGENFR